VLLEHLAPFGATASFAVGAPFERIPIGANRNLGMLLAGARPFVMVDDDMVCEISATDEHPGHVAIRDSEQLHYTQHFESEEALVAASRPTSVDYLSLHESVLGRSVRDILRSAQTYTLDVFDRDAVAAFSTPSRVVASTTGCHGDIGIGQPIRLLLDPRFVEVARADYASAFASVRSRRAPASLVLRRGFASMLGGGLGLDGRELLPPFAPWFRQEDVLFSALLARTHRNDHVAGLPWSLAHRPVRAVAAAADVYDVTESPNRALFALLSASLFVEAEKDAAFGPEDVLRSASLELSALCRSTRSLQTRLDYFWSHLQASAIDSWAQVAERATEPAVRSDAERMLQGARQRFASHHQFGSEAEGSDVREYAARYGELLGAWPDLVSAAREAASSGDIAPRV
jgi:hypothetical protein